MTDAVARAIFPMALAAALALWVRGYAEVGDGFSAGAIAGTGAVLQYVALDYERARRRAGARAFPALLACGLLLALAVVLAPLVLGKPPVTHYPPPGAEVAKIGALELHTAALFDLGIMLAVYAAIASTFDRLFPLYRGDEK